jgi:tetratricopeptide (TPR) repeat protein
MKKKGAKVPLPGSLALAELSFQRGDIPQTLKQIQRLKAGGMRTSRIHNLEGCCYASQFEMDSAHASFDRAIKSAGKIKKNSEKARFNQALCLLYADLDTYGDFTAIRQTMAKHLLYAQVKGTGTPFRRSMEAFETLYPVMTHFLAASYAYGAMAALLGGHLNESLSLCAKGLDAKGKMFANHFVTGKVFLEHYFLWNFESIDFEIPAADWVEEDDHPEEERLGDFLEGEEFLDLALQHFHGALEQNPSSTEAALGAATVHFLREDYVAAQQMMLWVEGRDPQSILLHELVFWVTSLTLSVSPELAQSMARKLTQDQRLTRAERCFALMPPYFLI